jgi:hypothetical protein
MVHVAASQAPGRRVALGLRRLTWLSGSAGMESQHLLLMFSAASAELGSQATLLSLMSRAHCLPRGITTGSGFEPTDHPRGDVGRQGPGGQNGTGPPGTEVRAVGPAGRAHRKRSGRRAGPRAGDAGWRAGPRSHHAPQPYRGYKGNQDHYANAVRAKPSVCCRMDCRPAGYRFLPPPAVLLPRPCDGPFPLCQPRLA